MRTPPPAPTGSVEPVPSYRTDFAGGSLRAKFVDLFVRSTVKTIIAVWSHFPALPWPYHLIDFVGVLVRGPRDVARSDVRMPQCSAELTTPSSVDPGRFVVYLHGGAFLFGGRRLHRAMTARFAKDLRSQVLAITYRKLPDYSVSDSISDAVDGYRHALATGISPGNVTVMGDSAGGYLALMTAIEIRRQGLPSPGAVVAMAPLTDWDMSAKLAAPTADRCAVFTRKSTGRLRELAEKVGTGSALESPVHCDLTGLPPTLIQASSTEMLYPDAVLLADRLHEHGVPCELQIWPGQVHIFQAGAGVIPEADEAVSQIKKFLDRIAEVRHPLRSA